MHLVQVSAMTNSHTQQFFGQSAAEIYVNPVNVWADRTGQKSFLPR